MSVHQTTWRVQSDRALQARLAYELQLRLGTELQGWELFALVVDTAQHTERRSGDRFLARDQYMTLNVLRAQVLGEVRKSDRAPTT